MNSFHAQVHALVALLPQGKVVSYGKIAAALGRPRASREVGRAMHHCPDHLPWQRVVMADGTITGGSYATQRKALLQDEGITFTPSGKVNVKAHAIDPFELELMALSLN